MPTYVYQCSACEKIFEIQQRITEDALKDCECGAKGTLKRLIQPIAVMFKGSGFHINDYSASKAPAEETPAAKPAEAKTEAPKTESSEKGAEAAPAPAKAPEPAPSAAAAPESKT